MDTKTTKDRSSASGEGLGGASVSGSKYENEKSINGKQSIIECTQIFTL